MDELKKYLENTKTIKGIPKIIHQIWMNFDDKGSITPPGGFINQNPNNVKIPDDWRISQIEWKRLHPDWKYVLWTDDIIKEYIDTTYPQYINMFTNFPYAIQRVDTIRYFILRDFGGVYSDLDIVPLKSLNDYDFYGGDVYFLKSANTPCCYTNAFMISKPGVKLWQNMIDHIQKNDLPWYAIGKHLIVMTSTGPDGLTGVVNSFYGNIIVLPLVLFNTSDVKEIENGNSKMKSIQNGAMLYSIPGSKWHSWDSKLINFFYMHTDLVIFLCILFVLWIVYTWRSKIYYQKELSICSTAQSARIISTKKFK